MIFVDIMSHPPDISAGYAGQIVCRKRLHCKAGEYFSILRRMGNEVSYDDTLYTRARARKLPCLVYFKQETAIPPEGWDIEPTQRELLKKFKGKLKNQARGHTVTEFSGAHELASRLASDLHNWLFDRYLSPALSKAVRGNLRSEQAMALSGDLRHLATIHRDLLAQVAEEKRRLDEQRRLALAAFYQLTYVVPETRARFPDTARFRERA